MTLPIINLAIAETHSLIREGLINILIDHGDINVMIEASDGNELINKLEKTKPLPDICVLDTDMPNMDGFDTQLQIRKRWPSIKTLAISDHDSELFIIRMIQYGVCGYITKDTNGQMFHRALQTIYSGNFFYSEVTSKQFVNAIKSKHIKLPRFSMKEINFLKYCCYDLTYQQIADKLNVSSASINGLRDGLFKKLDVKSRTGLVVFSLKYGLVHLEHY